MADTPATRAMASAVGAAAIDALVVAVFVVAGRRSHHDEGAWDAVEVAAPFLIALALGWLVARAWRTPLAPRTGVVLWAVTLVVGMVLRRLVFDRGTAVAFVVVAGVFLLALPAWRLVLDRVRQRRAT
jgi:hypothetical protein